MKHRWLAPLGAVLAVAAVLRGSVLPRHAHNGRCSACVPEQVGFVLLPLCEPDGACRVQAVPYYPRAGDMVFYDNYNKFHHFVYKMVGTGPPTHAAIVFEENGRPVLLELTGPTIIGAKVCIMDVGPRLQGYSGSILIRRTHHPLTPEQNAGLAEFAHAQDGKDFAFSRILLQATPFRARTGLRRRCFGHTYLSRRRWICSELVVSGCSAAHFLDPHIYRANGIYPRDLCYDENVDLSSLYRPAVAWAPEPPADAGVASGSPLNGVLPPPRPAGEDDIGAGQGHPGNH